METNEEEEDEDAAGTPKNDASKGGGTGDSRMKPHLRVTRTSGGLVAHRARLRVKSQTPPPRRIRARYTQKCGFHASTRKSSWSQLRRSRVERLERVSRTRRRAQLSTHDRHSPRLPVLRSRERDGTSGGRRWRRRGDSSARIRPRRGETSRPEANFGLGTRHPGRAVGVRSRLRRRRCVTRLSLSRRFIDALGRAPPARTHRA